jgi:hypothetical protein
MPGSTFLSALILFSTATFAAVEAPTSAREGTKVLLTASEISDLKQWVENAKNDLALLQDDLRRGNLEERRKRTVAEFEAITGRSGAKENELLMRYTLNRALEINDLVGLTPAPSELQSLVAFLDSTIELSKGFYTDDQKYLEAIGRGEAPQLQLPMAIFAHQYAETLLLFSRTFLRPELEYRVTYKALGWLANDLNSSRNLARIQYGETITRVARLQKKYEENPAGDDQEILRNIRLFKWEYRERVLKHVSSVNADVMKSIELIKQKKLEEERLARMQEEDRRREISRLEVERMKKLAEIEEEKRQAEVERKLIEEEQRQLENLKNGLLKSGSKRTPILQIDTQSKRIYGRIFRSETTGRTFDFTLKNGKIEAHYSHQTSHFETKNVEFIDGDLLINMTSGHNWTIHPSKNPDCIIFDFGEKDTLCSSAKLPVTHNVDLHGVYISKTTSRFWIYEAQGKGHRAQFVHRGAVGWQRPTFVSPNGVRTQGASSDVYSFEWLSPDCILFSWGLAETDTLCRYSEKAITPHGIFKSETRQMIIRVLPDGGIDVDYNQAPGRKNVIYANNVGYIPDFQWGFVVENENCILIKWDVGLSDRLCKQKTD